jgi:translation initiation factor 1 (eIF-1/SUI1)
MSARVAASLHLKTEVQSTSKMQYNIKIKMMDKEHRKNVTSVYTITA